MAADFKLLLMPEITRIVSIDGEPAAVALAIPNLNELVAATSAASSSPSGCPSSSGASRCAGPSSARLILLGIRKKWRNVRKYAG